MNTDVQAHLSHDIELEENVRETRSVDLRFPLSPSEEWRVEPGDVTSTDPLSLDEDRRTQLYCRSCDMYLTNWKEI